MIPGFNHNIQYNGKTYHIQTEDSGLGNPHVITLLYLGGNIIAKKKTSYQDLMQMEHLPKIVRELMENQHKAMLRELIKGSFHAPPAVPPTPEPPQPLAKPPAPVVSSAPEIKPSEVEALFGAADKPERSLDEIILSYLSGDNS